MLKYSEQRDLYVELLRKISSILDMVLAGIIAGVAAGWFLDPEKQTITWHFPLVVFFVALLSVAMTFAAKRIGDAK